MKNRRNRVKTRKMLFVICIIFLFLIVSTSSIIAKEHIKKQTIYVSNGDTIWSISRFCIGDNNSINIQNVVKEIIDLNALENSNIFPGQELIVPIY